MSSFPLTAAVASRLEVREASGSTNAELRERAADATWPHRSVLLTRNQTAGRGRLDRSWQTPPGSALAISVLLRDAALPVEARGWIPLIAGAAMSDAVAAQLPRREVGVKWPNDVLVAGESGGKICGILAEAEGDVAIVIGAGVNTAMTPDQLPVATATSFAALGERCDEDRLVADYVRRLDELVSALSRAGDAVSAGVHAAVTSRCVTLGVPVKVMLPSGGQIEGRASRLEEDGRLVVDAQGTLHTVSAGDVVHVRPA